MSRWLAPIIIALIYSINAFSQSGPMGNNLYYEGEDYYTSCQDTEILRLQDELTLEFWILPIDFISKKKEDQNILSHCANFDKDGKLQAGIKIYYTPTMKFRLSWRFATAKTKKR